MEVLYKTNYIRTANNTFAKYIFDSMIEDISRYNGIITSADNEYEYI